MIGIIVSHASIAKEFLDVIEHIVGKKRKFLLYRSFLKIIWKKRKKFRLCQKGSTDNGVIVKYMFGGT